MIPDPWSIGLPLRRWRLCFFQNENPVYFEKLKPLGNQEKKGKIFLTTSEIAVYTVLTH
jgi:hypothetical protein